MPWTQQEDELLEQIIREKGHTRKWKEIAEELNARSDLEVYRHGRQCRERWNNHLDPNISRGPFTEEEDIKLFQIYKEVGKKWAEISKRMKNRTENAVKNRFNSLLKKFKNLQSASISEVQSIISTESDLDNTRFEKKFVDQFLQQSHTGGSKVKREKAKRSATQNEIQENSESIFDSDTETRSIPKSMSYLDTISSRKVENPQDRICSLAELNDCFQPSFSSHFQMEEERKEIRSLPNIKSNNFEKNFPDLSERGNLPLNNEDITFPQPSFSVNQFDSTSRLNDQKLMIPESPGRDPSCDLSFLAQPKTENQRVSLPKFLFENNTPSSFPLRSAEYHKPTSVDVELNTVKNPLLTNSNSLVIDHSIDLFGCENSNTNSGKHQDMFPFENFVSKTGNDSFTNFEGLRAEIPTPQSRDFGTNHQFKTKKLNMSQTQGQIGGANLQYAIVDLTTKEIYVVNPVTKENFNRTLAKMNGDNLQPSFPFENAANELKYADSSFLGKNKEQQSPSESAFQALFGKSNSTSEANSSVVLPPTFENVEQPKLNSINLVERQFQAIRRKFGLGDNSENQFKNNGSLF